MKYKNLIFLLVFFLIGCAKAKDYVAVKRGAVFINLNVPLGEGFVKKPYLKIGQTIIDNGQRKIDVRRELGKPSQEGFTLDGYEFYRYTDKDVEIYFYGNRVVDWKGIEFRP